MMGSWVALSTMFGGEALRGALAGVQAGVGNGGSAVSEEPSFGNGGVFAGGEATGAASGQGGAGAGSADGTLWASEEGIVRAAAGGRTALVAGVCGASISGWRASLTACCLSGQPGRPRFCRNRGGALMRSWVALSTMPGGEALGGELAGVWAGVGNGGSPVGERPSFGNEGALVGGEVTAAVIGQGGAAAGATTAAMAATGSEILDVNVCYTPHEPATQTHGRREAERDERKCDRDGRT